VQEEMSQLVQMSELQNTLNEASEAMRQFYVYSVSRLENIRPIGAHAQAP
jgi:hypothetical protein